MHHFNLHRHEKTLPSDGISNADLGEAPTWDARTQRLFFVDINAKKIHVLQYDTKEHFTIDAPEMVGTVALTDNENLILAAMHRHAASELM